MRVESFVESMGMGLPILGNEAIVLTDHVGGTISEDDPNNMKMVREVVSGDRDNRGGAGTLNCRNRDFGWRRRGDCLRR